PLKDKDKDFLYSTLFSLQRSVADRDETIQTLQSKLRRKEEETQASEVEAGALRSSIQELQGQLDAQKALVPQVTEEVTESDIGINERPTGPAGMHDESFNTDAGIQAHDQSLS